MRENVRRIPLDGAVNFRDLGGYLNAQGQPLKWGLLFRSDSLAALSDSDLAAISQLRLRNIFDLRHQHERQNNPNRIGSDWHAQVTPSDFILPAQSS